MVHNVLSVEAILADGSKAHFRRLDEGGGSVSEDLISHLLNLGRREADEINKRFPKLLRRVGGYNIDELTKGSPNLGSLLVGSEGTLGFFQKIHLKVQQFLKRRCWESATSQHFMRQWRALSTLLSLILRQLS